MFPSQGVSGPPFSVRTWLCKLGFFTTSLQTRDRKPSLDCVIILDSRSKEETVGVLEKRLLGPGMETCAPQMGTGRHSRTFMQALPTTSRAGWLLPVHGIRILQLQLLEEDAVGISREHSFLGRQHPQSSRDPAPASGWRLWEYRTLQMCSREAHLGRVTSQKLPFSLPTSLGTKTLPEARSRGLRSSAILLLTVCRGDSTGVHEDSENRLWEWLSRHNGKSDATFTVQEKKSAIEYNKYLGVFNFPNILSRNAATVVQLLSHASVFNPMDCNTPGPSVLCYLLEFAPTHVHWVCDANRPPHLLSSPSPPALNLPQHQGLSQWVSSSHQVDKGLDLQLQHQSFQWIFRFGYLKVPTSISSTTAWIKESIFA